MMVDKGKQSTTLDHLAKMNSNEALEEWRNAWSFVVGAPNKGEFQLAYIKPNI